MSSRPVRFTKWPNKSRLPILRKPIRSPNSSRSSRNTLFRKLFKKTPISKAKTSTQLPSLKRATPRSISSRSDTLSPAKSSASSSRSGTDPGSWWGSSVDIKAGSALFRSTPAISSLPLGLQTGPLNFGIWQVENSNWPTPDTLAEWDRSFFLKDTLTSSLVLRTRPSNVGI